MIIPFSHRVLHTLHGYLMPLFLKDLTDLKCVIKIHLNRL
jgi:hypothetical protein